MLQHAEFHGAGGTFRSDWRMVAVDSYLRDQILIFWKGSAKLIGGGFKGLVCRRKDSDPHV